MLAQYEQITTLSNLIDKLRDDLNAAHKRIGALKYTLERHGIAIPDFDD